MRCPNCNKFVPYDTEVEPEEDSAPEAVDMRFAASFRRVLTCEECSEELKEAIIEVEYDLGGDTLDKPGTCKQDEHDWEVERCDVDATTNTVGKGRRPKTFYGVHCDVVLKCSAEGCDAEHTFEVSAEEQASSFEELT